jgi:hypothetical protein
MHWAAIAVETVRVDGKPTQRRIAYIGGITATAIRIVRQRFRFWRKVELKRLGNRIGTRDGGASDKRSRGARDAAERAKSSDGRVSHPISPRR